MRFILAPASEEYKPVLENLMQFYMYDFSEFVELDVESDGKFTAYPHLEDYWQEGNSKLPYLVKKEEKFIGFVLVKLIETTEGSYFSIAEFFVMKKYRREGIGKAAAFRIFDLHKGGWEVFQRENNTPARLFWINVISQYTKGEFQERFEEGKHIQVFKS
jgi:predicted acetyltransferase